VLPRKQKDLFPPPGVLFDLTDGQATYKVKVDSQYRVRLPEWFGNHSGVKAGDEIVFSKENGIMRIGLADTAESRTVSFKDLIGKETEQGRIIDIQQSSKGTVAVVQSTVEVPLDKILSAL
jgi:bifunctional DNA-binding transcriptional regulator/antitoxin component of YhaV-PrlF toxin-antitoxin module